jgi:uncharacterized damage-inducible protein DinB
MNVEPIASLYEYGVWANERLLGHAQKLGPETLAREFTKGCQSIHATFVHLVSADWRWFARFRGETPPPMLATADLPTLDAVRARWTALTEPRRAYLAGLSDADLGENIRWVMGAETRILPRWQALLQCANHGTQHRAEIAAMVTEAGHSPGDLDYSIFCMAKRS